MADKLDQCLEFCILRETGSDKNGDGGYTNDPDDPGGETKWGISKKSYPNVDIKNLTYTDAYLIYQKDFWLPIRGDDLPLPVALVMFEQGVNQYGSCRGAVKALQKSLGVSIDGVFGNGTLTALRQAKDLPKLILRLCEIRTEMYLTLNNAAEEKYEKGWVWRLLACQSKALEWHYKGT